MKHLLDVVRVGAWNSLDCGAQRVLISEAQFSPVSFLRVSRKVACGLCLVLCSSIFWLVVLCGYRAIHRRPAFSRTMWIPCHMHFCISHSWFRRPHWCKWLPVEQTYCYGSLRFTSQRFPQGVGQGAMNQGTRGYCKLECVSSRQYVWWLLLFVGDIQRRPASSKTIWMPNHMYICAL